MAKTPVAERYLYLPSVALALLVPWASLRPPRGAIPPLLLSAAFLPVTFARCTLWSDKLALWEDTVRKSPRFGTPRNQYGVALMERGRIEEALRQFALVLEPSTVASAETRAHAADNIGFIHMQRGRLEEAIPYFLRAIRMAPWDVVAYHNLGIVYLEMARRSHRVEQLDRSRRYLERAVAVDPGVIDTHYFLGVVYAHLGRRREALREFRAVVEMDPQHPCVPGARRWLRRLSRGG